ncbi:sensor domain-containing phosphodiesterase, partial [Vibrio sp. D173a]|uniref:FIST N-terminal domain-containing protein n=1 Tax=Vibrio sp. D173a TaxID=2836349 RepID=UPI0025562B4D
MQSFSLFIHDIEQLAVELESIGFTTSDTLLVQVFSSFDQERVESACQIIHARFPAATSIGCSAEHFIDKGELKHQGLLAVFTCFFSVSMSAAAVAYSDDLARDSDIMMRQLECNSQTKTAICFADRLTLDKHDLFYAFERSPLDIPVCGGASTITPSGRWVMCNGRCYQETYVMVALHSDDLAVNRGYFTEWNPIGKTFRVTAAQGTHLIELDG